MDYVHLDVHQEKDVNLIAEMCGSVFGKIDFGVVGIELQIHILCFLGSQEKMILAVKQMLVVNDSVAADESFSVANEPLEHIFVPFSAAVLNFDLTFDSGTCPLAVVADGCT